MTRIAAIPALALAPSISATRAAVAAETAVTLVIDAEADATFFAMAGDQRFE